MIEAIRNWFQDWSDACEYANECAPDFSFIETFQPNKWLQLITILSFICLAINEWRIKKSTMIVRKLSKTRQTALALRRSFRVQSWEILLQQATSQ